MLKTLAIAVAVAAVTAFSLAGSADAGGKGKGFHRGHHGHHGHHHWRHFRHYTPIYVEVRGCSRLYHLWRETGRHHWKKQYYICKGWW